MSEQAVYTADEFEAESRYLDTLIWEAIAVEPHTSVLFCGYGDDGRLISRALDMGADVTVIEHRSEMIQRFAHLKAKVLRGSTSVMPAKDNTFDLAISFHYLHEVDPFFHAQVLSELSRVARRIAVVEPAPPADPLGKQIALLYSQAKREFGQFEYYQSLEYWKKLLQSVKADVSQHVFAFSKVPPREYLLDTVKLMLDTIEIEDAPREFMDELRRIAQRSDVQLLPPPRYVLVGAAVGELRVPQFSPRVAPAAIQVKPSAVAPAAIPAVAPAAAQAPASPVSTQEGYEFPPVTPPAAAPAAKPPSPPPAAPVRPAAPPAAPREVEPAPAFSPSFNFGAPPVPEPPASNLPFGTPFAVPDASVDAAPSFGIPAGGAPPTAWEWEAPEGDSPGPGFS